MKEYNNCTTLHFVAEWERNFGVPHILSYVTPFNNLGNEELFLCQM